jgi:glycosyltransferase involved in cell wall biosynthesis
MQPASGADTRSQGANRLEVGVVIPTRSRPESLHRLLRALGRQDTPPGHVIVVDAGDPPLDPAALADVHRALPLTHLVAPPGVCAQRNAGLALVRQRYVLLCDDDIEPPPDYLRRLADFLDAEPGISAATGVLSEPGHDGGYATGLAAPSFRQLLFAFLFQLTVWGDVEATRGPAPARPLIALMRRWYRRRGNGFSLAGWPLFTRVRGPVARTSSYGLGAAMIRRDRLPPSPFDERLGPHGIGDNYGVALALPGERPIAVLTDLPVRHHRAAENRLDPVEAHFDRVLALDYFVRTRPRTPRLATAFLAWSLLGLALRAALRARGRLLRRELRALALVVTGRNPLLRTPAGPPASGAEPR